MQRATKQLIIRALWLGLYCMFSFMCVFWFAGFGHGSYAPPAILYSWGIIPWQYGLVGEVFGICVLPFFYLVGFFFLNTIVGKSAVISAALFPTAFHVGGVLIALVGMEHGHLNTPLRLSASIAVSAPLGVVYLFVDLWLLRRDNG